MSNKAEVTIYGQTYVISGDESSEHITKIAEYVNQKMNDIYTALQPKSEEKLAVISAVNICEEMFAAKEKHVELEEKIKVLEANVKKYTELWEEKTAEMEEYINDSKELSAQKDKLQKQLNEKQNELEIVKEKAKEELEKVMNNADGSVSELQTKCKELENSFFDIQMENIQLKKQISALKKQQQI